ncbi:hypothetical protein D8674_000244 [Pyrus ussuriensis x Pyrus communis]|uniref:Uncharacterized protein n=1 Tax=Pyrus ussuriensis x Pyrus communis TaxID=2448454 RepID=A0A5N5FFZ1_9ROSA|nr:hypothetical protein D8674_000244 [Pyrus ussuriensis x Pyrus communis]
MPLTRSEKRLGLPVPLVVVVSAPSSRVSHILGGRVVDGWVGSGLSPRREWVGILYLVGIGREIKWRIWVTGRDGRDGVVNFGSTVSKSNHSDWRNEGGVHNWDEGENEGKVAILKKSSNGTFTCVL